MAWVGLALTALYRCTRAKRFLDGAVHIGQWVETNARSETGLRGYSGGVDGANNRLAFHATEHNIDLVALFGQLADLTRDKAWRERRAHAAAFVASMWQRDGGFFATGTDDGVAVNTGIVPEDVQSWSFLALRDRRFARSVDWAAANLKVLDTASRPNSVLTGSQRFGGVTFSSRSLLANEGAPIAPFQPKPDRNGVWFEGTAHLAAALRQRRNHGDESRARTLLGQVESAQDTLGVGQTVGGKALPDRSGVVSASSPLDTGFGFGYYPNRHVGATAWYVLAQTRSNPLNG
jgi:hypothetical protein